jgi:hypothetical protein
VLSDSNSGLSPAHKGYIYQDQATSYVLVASLLERFDEVTVDRKAVEEDRFDDLAVRHNSRYVKRQFKASDNLGLTFNLADLYSKTSRKLTIDTLVRSFTRAGAAAADEYRLCATWRTPTDPKALGFLEPSTAAPSFPGHPSKTFRLRAEIIWPDGGTPIWRPLQNASDITRQEFLDFAERFIIELECPLASYDFSKPSQLETLILDLLADSVGIGRYPNQNRSPVDVAARLQQFAARARSDQLTVTPPEVERELQLRKDFGRVEQQFPVVRTDVVKRTGLRQEIVGRLGSRRVIVVGPPGSGKSWELTGLADDLKSNGYLVARHYCYLEPGDPEVQRRITTDVMFANLLYDLTQANPALEQLHRPAYSAGPRELEDLLKKGVDQGLISKVALVVDGIDHVSRVFAESTGVAKEEVDIVEELATLDLPDEVCLIIGSQPGAHLEPLHDSASYVPMPPWRSIEIAALARRLGVPSALRDVGLGESVRAFLDQLHERSEGNPLYATFLCRQTLERIAKGVVFDPIADLRDAPLTGGNISRYYDYLLNGAEAGAATVPVAELLGLIDFALTEEELKEIHPWLSHRIKAAVSHLAPVLVPARVRAGIRIYHESFRRFINQRLRERGGSAEDVLAPVIEWLKRRGFFSDARAYRFLLPTLRRASRHKELLALVGTDFVSRSVEAGHSEAAVEQNLMLTTYVAAEDLSWSALARCVELHKSCTVCFQDKLTDYGLFGRAFVTVHGAAALAERLLFDGRPTFTANQGLIFCSLCDDAGVVPPWEQYLSLARKRGDDEEDGRDPEWVNYAIAEIHGAIRLDGVEDVYAKVVTWLGRASDPHPEYFRGLLKRLVQFGGGSVLERLLKEVGGMHPEAEAAVKAELAHAFVAQGRTEEAAVAATEAVRRSLSSALAAECLALGADSTEVAKRCPSLDRAGAGPHEERYHPEAVDVRLWVDGVKIAAATDPTKLSVVEGNIRGEGWYRNWLRFVISLSRAEEQAASDAAGAETVVLDAFRLLASDTHPYKGKPRAMDLYMVREVIHETFARALNLIRTPANFEAALTYLAEVSRGTTSSLQRSPNGPLIPQEFIELLMPFIGSVDFKTAALAEMMRQHQLITNGSQLYDNVASADLLLARAQMESGDTDAANRLWQVASVHLCAYGYRKEISIFDLTDSAVALGKTDNDRAAQLLAAAQPLVNAVVAHTDGKVTRNAPVRWAEAVSEVNPAGGAYVLARSLVRHGGAIDWRYEDALQDVIDAARKAGAPSLLAFLDMTLPFSGGSEALEKKLSTIGRLIEEDAEAGTRLLRILAAKVHGDPKDFDPAAYDRVKAFALATGVTLPEPTGNAEANRKDTSSYSSPPDPYASFRDNAIFPLGATPLALMAAIRAARRSMTDADAGHDRLVNAFGYRLIELLEKGEEDEAVRLLRSFARETYFWQGATPLADIAEGLARQGHTRAAAVAFSLAFARSRGGGGYLLLGDENHLPWLLRAGALSLDISLHALADEVAYLLNQQRHYVGITRHLVEALAAQVETREAAFEAWQAAYEVLRHRLPRNEADHYVFEKYEPATVSAWTLNESLVFLLLARSCHPELGRKISAVTGVAFIVSRFPEIVGTPLRNFLSVDVPVSSALLVLQTLLVVEEAPYAVTVAIQEELRGFYHSGLFGPRVMAQMLLDRAGLSLGEARRRVTPTAEPVSPQWREVVYSLDWGARLENIGRIWPAFLDILASLFHLTWEGSEVYKEKASSRFESAKSRVYDDLPPTEFLFWHTEIFEMLFHEVLEGIDSHLPETAAEHTDFFPWLLKNVLPHLYLHIARWYSRVPRPPLPLPREQSTGVIASSAITGEGGYDGWYRCGYFETELVIRDNFNVGEEVRVLSSIHFPENAGDADPLFGPLDQGDAEAWLGLQDEETTLPSDLRGSLVGIDDVENWLGSFSLLMLQPDIQAQLGLSTSSDQQNRLELVDELGHVAVVFRHWAERPVGDRISEEAPRLQGGDLLVRPDVFARIEQIAGRPPITVTLNARDVEEIDNNDALAMDIATGQQV